MQLRKVFLALSLAVLSFTTLSGLGQEQKGKEGRSEAVKGSGCVRRGVEAGCLILKESKSKKVYSLHFLADKKPDADTAISFEGKRQDLDSCQQGTAVAVASWTALKMKCPASGKPVENLTAKGTGRPKPLGAVDMQVDCSVPARNGGYRTVQVRGDTCESAQNACRGLSEGVVTSACY